jgi:hypothetical protein
VLGGLLAGLVIDAREYPLNEVVLARRQQTLTGTTEGAHGYRE